MAAKYVAPSAKLDSFNCPYCQTLAHQTWYSTLASADEDDNKPPIVSYSEAEIEHLEDNTKTMHLADLAKKSKFWEFSLTPRISTTESQFGI
jgi:hypothetical protein